jgi:hypothetical protein
MSTVGFQAPTPTNGATLNVGQPYVFRIGVVVDDAMAESAIVLPEVTAGEATIDPAEAQAIDDSVLPNPDSADWTITPTAPGTLTVVATVIEGELLVAGGAGEGSRTFTVASTATAAPARLGLGIGLGL